jgi:hypothetical protein
VADVASKIKIILRKFQKFPNLKKFQKVPNNSKMRIFFFNGLLRFFKNFFPQNLRTNNTKLTQKKQNEKKN